MGRHGENIHKRSDGRWEARFIQGYNNEGKAHYRYLYGKSYLEVKRKKQEALQKLNDIESDHHDLNKYTFRQLTDEWLMSREQFVKASTYVHYKNIINNHFLPAFGEKIICEITQAQVEQFLLDQFTSGRKDGTGGLSRKTVLDMKAILKLILEYGEKKGHKTISKFSFTLPATSNKSLSTLSKQEQECLEKILYLKEEPFYIGILISLYTGLRIGEVCALQWKDINFKEGVLNINKTLLRIQNAHPDTLEKTKIVIEKPKTLCSYRTIPLSDFLLTILYEEKQNDEIYLLTGKSQYMEPRLFLNKYKKVLKKAGLKNYTYHTLRHTFATRCIENNVDIKSLSEIMGHSNVNITMQRYVHPSLELKRAQLNKLLPSSFCSQKKSQTPHILSI